MSRGGAWVGLEPVRAWHALLLAVACVLGCGAPPTHSPQASDRILALQQADTSEVLRLATTDRSPQVRGAAVARIDDQAVLARIARNDASSGVRKAAVERLLSDEDLRRVVMEDRELSVRQAALTRVSGQAALLAIAKDVRWPPELAIVAIQRINDADALKDVVAHQPAPDVRAAAIARIDDQAFLEQLAESRTSSTVSEAAVSRLRDPSGALARMAQDSSDFYRAIASRKTNDPALLVKLTRDRSGWVAGEAAARVSDVALLEALASNSPHVEVRRKVVPRVSNPSVLARVARTESDPEVQKSIAAQTENPAILADLALNARVVAVGCPIAARLQDVQAVRRLAERAASDNTRRVARLRLLMAHPAVKRHSEGLQLNCVAGTVTQPYWFHNPTYVGPRGSPEFVQDGETAELRLLRHGAVVTQQSWKAAFPQMLGGRLQLPVPIAVNISPLAAAVLELAPLDPDELAQLGGSDIGPEIRLAAINRMTDVDALRQLASREPEVHVIEAIQLRLRAVATR